MVRRIKEYEQNGGHAIIRRIDLSFIIKTICILLISCNVVATGDIDGPSLGTDVPSTASLTLPVPYYDQGDTSWCLYYCLSMMFNYNNRQVEPWEIASHFNSGHSETFSGQYNAFDHSLEDYSRETWSLRTKRTLWGYNIGNFDVENFNSMITDNIDRGQPVLLAFQYTTADSTKKGHAVVAVGYDEEHIYLTDPSGAVTEGLFGAGKGCIAVPVRWREFNEKLIRNILPTNMAFSIEVLEDAPERTPEGSIYLKDNTDHNYSCVYFTDRFNSNDVGLLRFDGRYDSGYRIVREGNVSAEREPSARDTLSLYFTVANPTTKQKKYTVISEAINMRYGQSLDGFFFSTELDVGAHEVLSKGINYSNQLGTISSGDCSFVLTLLDENDRRIDSVVIDLHIPPAC